jgi:hypothetical protein
MIIQGMTTVSMQKQKKNGLFNDSNLAMRLRLQALCGIFNDLLKRQVSHGYHTRSLSFPLLDPAEIT